MTVQPFAGHHGTVPDDYDDVDKDGRPEPAYVQVANILRRRIESGRLRNWLPSRRELREQYGVSQGTVERALAILTAEGAVSSVRGRGFFVNRQEG
jgi:GntR family transcriptional regulator